ncbi:MAG TPA: response regulator [Tepidisphaeraceae bacterium]|nr:response regulator [Tepidisphaeraceae bacterium]
MSAVSLPVTRPSGFALLVGNPASRNEPLAILSDLGYGCDEADDPYSAFLELCQRPTAFNTVILSLASIYREELLIIPAIRRRFPHLDVWLTQTDGRHSAMAEAIRLGADGLLSEDGMHRIALPPAATDAAASADSTSRMSDDGDEPDRINGFGRPSADAERGPDIFSDELADGEPVLTAEELRALLQEQPATASRATGGYP